jgi:hypothetical protein
VSGEWDNDPTGYTYAWLRCDSAGASCSAISGATSGTYVVQADDAGATIRFRVTAANTYGSATATSDQTTVVPGSGPTTTTSGSTTTTTEAPTTTTVAPTTTTTPVPGAPPAPITETSPVNPTLDPGCRYSAASADVDSLDEVAHGFAQFSGAGCENDGKLVYFTYSGEQSDQPVTELSPYAGRVLAVSGDGTGTFVLYVTPAGQVRIASRTTDGEFTPGRPLVTLDAARGRQVTGTVDAAGGRWWATWSEPSGDLYESRTVGSALNRRLVDGAHTRATGSSTQPSIALRAGGQATLTFVGPDRRVWVATTPGGSAGWSSRAFELAPARADGYGGPRVVVDGRWTYMTWTGLRASPGPYVEQADNTGGSWVRYTFKTPGRDPRIAAADGKVRLAWTTPAGGGQPSRVYSVRRDTPVGAWDGLYISPEATTDQVAADVIYADGYTLVVIRSSLRLYVRTYR